MFFLSVFLTSKDCIYNKQFSHYYACQKESLLGALKVLSILFHFKMTCFALI